MLPHHCFGNWAGHHKLIAQTRVFIGNRFHAERMMPRPFYWCKRLFMEKILMWYKRFLLKLNSPCSIPHTIFVRRPPLYGRRNKIPLQSAYLWFVHWILLIWELLYIGSPQNQIDLEKYTPAGSTWRTPKVYFWHYRTFAIVTFTVNWFRFSLHSLFWSLPLFFPNLFWNPITVVTRINYSNFFKLLIQLSAKPWLNNIVWLCSWAP